MKWVGETKEQIRKQVKAHAGAIFEGRLTDMYDAVIGATHWMPMPEAPQVEQ